MHPLPLLLLALGFGAHVVGDFVLQTEAIVRGKQSSDRVLLWHIAQHVLALGALLAAGWGVLRALVRPIPAIPSPFELGMMLGGVAVSHWAIDKTKILIDRRRGGSTTSYVVDQMAHVVALGLLVSWVRGRHADWEQATLRAVDIAGLQVSIGGLATFLLVVGGYVYAMRAGAIFGWMVTLPLTRGLEAITLEAAGVPPLPLRDRRALRAGYLARFVGVTCVLAGALWALAIVVAARAVWLGRRAARGAPRVWTEYAALELAGSVSTVLAVGVVLRLLLR